MPHALKILWLDVETTGLDARRNDIVQLAGIIDINAIAAEEFNYFVQPFSFENIDKNALDTNGITMDQLKSFDAPERIHGKLIEHLERYVDRYDRSDKMFIAGQNPGFDRDFLKAFFEKNNDKYFGSWFDYHIIDLCGISTLFHIKGTIDLFNPEKNRVDVSLKNLSKAFGYTQKEPHDALDDIRLTRQIFYDHLLERVF